MKLPFLNRKRYIVLKCYTTHAGVLKYAPITTNYKEEKIDTSGLFAHENAHYFDSCWSRIKSKTASATIPSPMTITVKNKNGECGYSFSDGNIPAMNVAFVHNNDPFWPTKDVTIGKLMLPWQVEEDTGVNFILARHISNKTMCNILSGILEFKDNSSLNLFNLTAKVDHEYEIPFNTPLASLYPMSDLPLHVETYHDEQKFLALNQCSYRRFHRGNLIKTERAMKEM